MEPNSLSASTCKVVGDYQTHLLTKSSLLTVWTIHLFLLTGKLKDWIACAMKIDIIHYFKAAQENCIVNISDDIEDWLIWYRSCQKKVEEAELCSDLFVY